MGLQTSDGFLMVFRLPIPFGAFLTPAGFKALKPCAHVHRRLSLLPKGAYCTEHLKFNNSKPPVDEFEWLECVQCYQSTWEVLQVTVV